MNTLILLIIYQVLSQSCRNKEGEEVEWWVILNIKIDNGYSYLYCDSEICNELTYDESNQINNDNSPLTQAMREIESSDQKSTMNVIWSDKEPFKLKQEQMDQSGDQRDEQDKHPKAHSKGMLSASWEKQYGFIINHSMSKFPLIDDDKKLKLKFGENAGQKAEHFFCVTLDIQDIEEMAELYSLAQINTYKYNEVDEQFKNDYPNIYNLRQTNTILDSNSPSNKTIVVQTDGHSNLVISVFAINSKYKKNIYEFIMDELNIGLITESWTKSKMNIEEQGHILVHNQQIYYDKKNKIINFNSNEDHSKYAISDTEEQPYICFSDLGLLSRKPKGGTALCFEHYNLWKDIRKSFVKIQKQDKPPGRETGMRPHPIQTLENDRQTSPQIQKLMRSVRNTDT